ncbi:MAG: hypothetical protein ACOYWZ_09535 [Bacillota bacterium]
MAIDLIEKLNITPTVQEDTHSLSSQGDFEGTGANLIKGKNYDTTSVSGSIKAALVDSYYQESSLIYLPRQDMTTPVKTYYGYTHKSGSGDVVTLMRSGSTQTIDTENTISACWKESKTDFDAGTMSNIENIATKGFATGVCNFSGDSYLNQINTINNPTGNNWTGHTLAVDKGAGTTGYNSLHSANAAVIKDGFTYKMWYTGSNGTNERILYATSTDGESWSGHTLAVNIGAGTTGYNSVYSCVPTVIKDGSTYKMWYSGSDGANQRILYATSVDGNNWTGHTLAVDKGAGTTGYNSAFSCNCTVIKDGSTFKMWYSGYNGVDQRILYATSADGETWSGHTLAVSMGAGTSGYNSVYVCAPVVIKDGSTYKMWYTGYNGTNERILYATSTDGENWTGHTLAVNIGSGATGYNSVHSCAPTAIKDGSTYKMWYAGYNGTNLRILYASGVNNYYTNGYYTIDINCTSSYLTDYYVLHTDIVGGTSLTIQEKVAATQTDLDAATYNTAQSLTKTGNNQVNAIKVEGSSANIWKRVRINFTSDNTGTAVVRSIGLVLQPTNWERCVDVSVTTTNAKNLALNKYQQLILCGANTQTATYEVTQVDILVKYFLIDLYNASLNPNRICHCKKIVFCTDNPVYAIARAAETSAYDRTKFSDRTPVQQNTITSPDEWYYDGTGEAGSHFRANITVVSPAIADAYVYATNPTQVYHRLYKEDAVTELPTTGSGLDLEYTEDYLSFNVDDIANDNIYSPSETGRIRVIKNIHTANLTNVQLVLKGNGARFLQGSSTGTGGWVTFADDGSVALTLTSSIAPNATQNFYIRANADATATVGTYTIVYDLLYNIVM